LPRIAWWWRGRTVFISYRRAGGAFASGWLRDRLSACLGAGRVIRDVESIPPGTSFYDFVKGVIPDCRAVIVVIDPGWSVAPASAEGRYAELPGDMVAFELAEAFKSGIRVIPVLVRGASMPKAADLPEALRPLAQLHAVELRPDHNFSIDVDRLVAALRL
jgi:hypothetical protein